MKKPATRGWAVVADFDGTITTFDIGDAVCMHFGAATKEEIEAGFAPGVPVPWWMKHYFGRLRASEAEVRNFLRSEVKQREGFSDFASSCRAAGIPLEIASGGTDLYIAPLLRQWKASFIKTSCGLHGRTKRGTYTVRYPMLRGRTLERFKADRVRHYQRRGYRVIFCGDGPSDFDAAKAADISFARHRLLVLCEKRGVKVQPLTSFRKILAFMERNK